MRNGRKLFSGFVSTEKYDYLMEIYSFYGKMEMFLSVMVWTDIALSVLPIWMT